MSQSNMDAQDRWEKEREADREAFHSRYINPTSRGQIIDEVLAAVAQDKPYMFFIGQEYTDDSVTWITLTNGEDESVINALQGLAELFGNRADEPVDDTPPTP